MIDHRLQVLRLLAHHGTVTATAEALHYTPSAVSAQLRSLSEQLGVTLLVPKGRGVKLTPAGRLLLSRADDLYERWEQIRAELVAGTDDTMHHDGGIRPKEIAQGKILLCCSRPLEDLIVEA